MLIKYSDLKLLKTFLKKQISDKDLNPEITVEIGDSNIQFTLFTKNNSVAKITCFQSSQNVPVQIDQIEIKQTGKRIPFSEQDIIYITDNYNCKTPGEIAFHLNRSVGAIHTKASSLKLTRPSEDLKIGTRFGRLIVCEKTNEKDGTTFIYKCLCDCGQITNVSRGRLTKINGTKSCGCLRNEVAQQFHLKTPGEVSYRLLINNYKAGASNRNLDWNLTDEEALSIFSKDCSYCGLPPQKYNRYLKKNNTLFFKKTKQATIDRAWINYTGIDRVDSSLGYSSDNCVPCCKTCNVAKMNMPKEEWDNYLQRLTSFRGD